MKKIISSRANWSLMAMFVIGGVEAISGVIPASVLPVIEGLLGLMTIYFVRNPSQDYSK